MKVHSRPTSDFRGARGSNAGDQFHELWALEQILALLDATTGLTAVTVEGVVAPSGGAAQEGPCWDGVDCALYFGGASFATAQRVEFVQLKYSSDPDRPWSIARLAHNLAKSGNNNSVLRKLADSFIAARTGTPTGVAVRLRFISNQPVDDAVIQITQTMNGGDSPDDTLAQRRARVAEASGLTDADLLDFLAALDFSECGTASRFAQRERVMLAVSELIEDDATSDMADLRQRVRELMLPERAGELVTRQTVLSWFGIAHESGLFPCPPGTVEIDRPIPRHVARGIAESLVAGSRIVCLHGSGGCGKTTALRQISELLPDGSCFVLFDCYGGGRYLFSDDKRHLPQYAFLQLANDLALTLRTPFFLPGGRRQPIDVRQFLKRFSDAATVLARANQHALVVLAIDAADNAVTAAGRTSPPEPCFIHDLLDADLSSLPPNVRLVLTTRTARRATLHLPPNAVSLECPPFSISETAEYVRGFWTTATDPWIQQFHHLSGGIPRIQDYAIKAAAGDAASALDALRPGGAKLVDILQQLFEKALRKLGHEKIFNSLISGLAVLPPPIPPWHLAAVAGTNPDTVIDLATDLSPGLRLNEDGISIADEDFEDFINEKMLPDRGAVEASVASHFYQHFRSDLYAAIHLGDALVAAGRGQDLLGLIQDGASVQVIADPIVRQEVALRRLRLALRVCRHAGSAVDTLQVLLISADANKEEEALRAVLEKDVDLAVHFAWQSLRRLVLADRDSAEHQGTVLAQDAAKAARAGDLITARERVISHNAWLRRRSALSDRERQSWSVTVDDIVARAEAILELEGAEATIAEIERWRPRSVRILVALQLVPNLIAGGKLDIVQDVLDQRLLPEPWNLLLAIPLALAGRQVEATSIARSLSSLTQRHVPKGSEMGLSPRARGSKHAVFELFLTACELAVNLGVENEIVGTALRLLDAELWPHPSPLVPLSIDALIRIWLLKQQIEGGAASFDALLASIKARSPDNDTRARTKGNRRTSVNRDSQQDRLNANLKALYPVYAGRLSLIAGNGRSPDAEWVQRQLPGVAPDAYSFDLDIESTDLRENAAASVMRLMALPNVPWAALYLRASTLLVTPHGIGFQRDLLSLLEYLLLRQDAHTVVLETIVTKAKAVQEMRTVSSEKVESFVRFSRLLLRISLPDAGSLFASAVEITKEIDQEARDQISLLARLSKSSPALTSDVRREQATAIFRFVSGAAERLASYDGFPWEAAVVALARLSFPVGLAALARWADSGVASLQTTLQPLLLEGLILGSLSPSGAAGLAILLDEPDADLAQRILTLAEGSGLRLPIGEELAQDCLLHAPPGARLALGRRILSLVGNGVLASSEGMARLRTTVDFLEALPPASVKSHATVDFMGPLPPTPANSGATVASTSRDGAESEQRDAFDLGGRRFTTAKAICDVLGQSRPPNTLPLSRDLLNEMRKLTAIPDRVAFLNAVDDVDGQIISERERAAAILDALDAWRISPAVDQWRRQTLPRLIVRRFAALARGLNEGWSRLRDLTEAAELSVSDRLQVLIEGVETSGLALDSRALYGVAGMIVEDMQDLDASAVLKWYVERLGTRLPVDGARVLHPDDIPTKTTDAVARFLFALLGDIDTRIRWRTAHALRRLVRLGATDVLDAMLSDWNRLEDKSFRDPEAPYYWLAARLWLVMAIRRIAEETPHAVRPHLDLLARIATDPDLPHVVIREHAKRAALYLVDHGGGAVSSAVLASIRSTNEPRLPRTRTKRSIGGPYREDRRTKVSFNFDPMDTLPYWYSALVDLFPKITMDQILKQAENWIVGRWRAPSSANWWADEPRKGRYDERRYSLWSHRHGSLPTVERYGTYLEWHAMLCVVGELLETNALSRPTESFRSFEEWLERLLPTESHHWLSDLRMPTPLEIRLWVPDPRPDERWLRAPRASEFTAELGIGRHGRPGSIVVGGQSSVRFPSRQLTVTVSSALVAPETASALVRALQTARDPNDFRIPDEDEEFEIDAAPYRLIGWLADNHRDLRFDERDPLRHQATPLRRLPGRLVNRTLGLTYGRGAHARWTAATHGNQAFIGEVWSDLPDHEGDRGVRLSGSSGWRLWMATDDLQAFLGQQGMDLICEVQVIRRTHQEYSRAYEPDAKKAKTFHKIFLCRRDGWIDGATGRLGAWATVGRRTSA